MNVLSYPVGQAAKQYGESVKPVLSPIAKRLGFIVGGYSGHGSPSTVLRSIDETSSIASLVVYWKGLDIEVGVRSRKYVESMKTDLGRIAFSMSFGVHEAYGYSSDPVLSDRIEQAITNAVNAYKKKETSK